MHCEVTYSQLLGSSIIYTNITAKAFLLISNVNDKSLPYKRSFVIFASSITATYHGT